MSAHIPVLAEEAVENLQLKAGMRVVDCTFGDGGHSRRILKRIGPNGRLLAIDADEKNIKRARSSLKDQKNLVLVNDNFVHLKEIVCKYAFVPVNGILLDLGWSTTQFSESGRGFSFQKRDEPLDMRYGGNSQSLTAAEILNKWPEEEIGRVLREYGEEKNWRTIARLIVQYRKKCPFQTTAQLADLIKYPISHLRHQKIHPATRVFQALRIAVNDELNVLKRVLPQAVETLSKGGRLAVISFHSLEDRIVKRFFQKLDGKIIKIINKKPIAAGREELKDNPRSRSAKLRVSEKI